MAVREAQHVVDSRSHDASVLPEESTLQAYCQAVWLCFSLRPMQILVYPSTDDLRCSGVSIPTGFCKVLRTLETGRGLTRRGA